MKRNVLIAAALSSMCLTSSAFTGKTLYHFFDYTAMFWPKNTPVTVENYQNRLNACRNARFDTLVVSSMVGFGSVSGFLRSADVPRQQPSEESRWMRGYVNALPALEKLGADPIRLTIDWCRRNKKEIVIALPVNPRTHGDRPTAERGISSWRSYLWPAFKTKNPDALIEGTTEVDYGNALVRDKLVAIASEIVGKYDVDGLMVDFMDVPRLFRSVVAGGVAEPKEAAALTQMMQRIAAACKSASARLGHDVTFCARVPDSAGYCKDVGIDLSGWLDAKLLGAVMLGGDFHLSRWNAAGDLARKAGVPFYPVISGSGIFVSNDSGYSGDDERLRRQSRQTFAARVADALDCKADGCMYSQPHHWDPGGFGLDKIVPFDASANARESKRYFVSYTNDRRAGSYLKDWQKHRTVDSLLSFAPVSLAKGVERHSVFVWEDAASLRETGPDAPKAVFVTEATIPSGMETVVTFNGRECRPYKKMAGTQWYEVPLAQVRRGANEVTVKSKGKNRRGAMASLGNVVIELTYPKSAAEKKEGAR